MNLEDRSLERGRKIIALTREVFALAQKANNQHPHTVPETNRMDAGDTRPAVFFGAEETTAQA